jgi:hypothetical protein
VTKVVPVSEEKVSENFKGTELILETYFESYQVLESIFTTPEGHELMQMIENISPGEMNSFIGQQKRFHADWYKGDETKVDQRFLDMFHSIENTSDE